MSMKLVRRKEMMKWLVLKNDWKEKILPFLCWAVLFSSMALFLTFLFFKNFTLLVFDFSFVKYLSIDLYKELSRMNIFEFYSHAKEICVIVILFSVGCAFSVIIDE